VEEIGQKMGQRSAGNRGARAGKAGDRPKIGQLGRCRKMGAKCRKSGRSAGNREARSLPEKGSDRLKKWGQRDRPENGEGEIF
jgi:hypothetical protein